MADEWKEYPLPKVIDFQEGPGILAKDFREVGVPLVRLSGLDRGVSLLTGCNFLDPHTVEQRWSHFRLEEGDTLLSTSASLGRIAVVPPEARGAISYTGIIRMRPRDERLCGEFIRYLLEGPEFQRQVEMMGVGSVIRHFGPLHLRQMTVTVPPPDEQRAIAHILGRLDDKIELNQVMNGTLEAIARTIFKSWFVDFDPVRAKYEGRDPALPPHLAAIFPDRFSDSELGEIPKGWKVTPVGDALKALGGSTPSTKELKYWDSGKYHWATPKDLSGLTAPILLDTERKITESGLDQISSGLLPAGTVLMSSRAPVGYLALAAVPTAINQGFIAMICDGPVSNYYVLNWCYFNMDEIKQRASGTTFAEISKTAFRPISIVVPEKGVMQKFTEAAGPLYGAIQNSLEESSTLTTLRDSLLPKLISGELRVADTERIIGRHV